MLQRVQTVYLFLVFVFGVLYLIFSLATVHVGDESYTLMAYELIAPESIVERLNVWWLQTSLLIALFASMVLTIIITFKYKKRLLQMRLCKFNILLLLIVVVLSFFYIDSVKTQLNADIVYGAGTFFPFVSLILTFLANRAIRKDEELVRSADRIR